MMARYRKLNIDELAASLNEEQQQAFYHQDGPLCLLAVAGSGKTATLVKSIARRIAQGQASSRILAVTFSKKAADEMNERLEKLVGKYTECRVGTWHSLALQICKEHGYKNWTIDTKDSTKTILKQVTGYKGMKWEGVDIGRVARFVTLCKANAIFPHERAACMQMLAQVEGAWEGYRYVEAYAELQAELKRRHLLTFDDMLLFAYEILCKEENRKAWAAKWDVLYQDEAQDANQVQVLLAEQLTRDHHNYIAVGDLFQAIYGFRGSRPEFLAQFANQNKTITMFRNYRCGQKIIEAANVSIKEASVDGVESTELKAELQHHGNVKYISSYDLEEEGKALVAHAQEIAVDGSYGDLTVLFRTNAQSRALEEALLDAEIPYILIGGSSFYDRKEVKDLLGYLRLAYHSTIGEFDDEAFKRCINAPFRFLGAAFIDGVSEWMESNDTNDWLAAVNAVATRQGIQARQRASVAHWASLMREVDSRLDANPGELLQWLVDQTRYIDFIEKQEGAENIESSHAANIRELIRLAHKYQNVESLLKFIEVAQEKAKEQNQETPNKVTLMSIHRSKGLEFPHVFIAGCNEAILPHARGDENEERRLFYVATTRAKKSLVYSSVRWMALRSGTKEVLPSRFVTEIMGNE